MSAVPASRRLALVFELMDMNIYELIRGRRHYVAEERIKNYMYQLMKSMDHMHRNGIFHRWADRLLDRFASLPGSVIMPNGHHAQRSSCPTHMPMPNPHHTSIPFYLQRHQA